MVKECFEKLILHIGEMVDEISDSSFQNAVIITNQHKIKYFNPIVLGICYGNMKMLEKAKQSMIELPKISVIQLGMNKKEMDKKYVYFNASNKQDKKNERMTNIQYINMFHALNSGLKENQEKDEEKKEVKETFDENQEQNDQNCFEIEINKFLNDKKDEQERQDSGEEKNKGCQNIQELLIEEQKKCPKIIGSTEFLYLFQQVINLVKNYKSNVIIFSYDFSFTKAHNHLYDLNVDVLGYFCQMLSLISNHHLIFVVNTNNENHFFGQNTPQNDKFFGLDGNKSLRNYMNNKQYQAIVDTDNLTNLMNEDDKRKQDEGDDAQEDDPTGIIESGVWKKNNENTDKLQEIIKKRINLLQDSCEQSQFYKYLKNEYNILRKNIEGKNNQELKLFDDSNLQTLNLIECVQDQFLSVCFSLLQIINYHKLITSQKSYNQPEFSFMNEINQQIRQSIHPCIDNLNKNLLPQKQEQWKVNTTSVKVFDYSTKIKQSKYISNFKVNENKEKCEFLRKVHFKNTSNQKIEKKTEDDKKEFLNEGLQNFSKSFVEEDISQEEKDLLYTKELKIKIIVKRYTSALLKNYIYDIRRGKKVDLKIKHSNMNFFFQERSQYIVDYDQHQTKIIIYFFNVQRGQAFKNFILSETETGMFIENEIQIQIIEGIPKIYDFMWKSFMVDKNLKELKRNNYKDSYYVHEENVDDLELFNSALCISEDYIVRMFGEIINPRNWKQKEYQLLMFTIPRKKNFEQSNHQTIMKLVNLDFLNTHLIFNTIPRSGCTAINLKEEEENMIYVFGGTSYCGFMHNVIEKYQIHPHGLLEQISFRTKQFLDQKIFRPLICPFTFAYNDEIYFFGGEFNKNYISRTLDQVYFQKYNTKNKQFDIIQSLNQKDIKSIMYVDDKEISQYEKSLSYAIKKVCYSSTNINQLQIDQNFKFALTSKINSRNQLMLQKTVIIDINMNEQLNQEKNQQKFVSSNQKIPSIQSTTIIYNDTEVNIMKSYKKKLVFFKVSSTKGEIEKVQFDEFNVLSSRDYRKAIQDQKSVQMAEIIEEINQLSENTFSEDQEILNYKYDNEGYIKSVNKDYYEQSERNIFYPTYFLLHKKKDEDRQLNLIYSKKNQEKGQHNLELKFYVSVHLDEDDFKDFQFSNKTKFLTFNINFKRKFYTFFKTLSLQDAVELKIIQEAEETSNIKNWLYFTKVKFDQKKLTRLQFQKYDETLELKDLKLINRYISCDDDYIYLLNGVDYEEYCNQDQNIRNKMKYFNISPCERINIKNKVSERIDPCIFLEECHIIQNEKYIFYIGIYRDPKIEDEKRQEENENINQTHTNATATTESNNYYQRSENNQINNLIVQIFSKQKKKWRIIQLFIDYIRDSFEEFQFMIGDQLNNLFVFRQKYNQQHSIINQETKPTKKKFFEIVFDLKNTTYQFKLHDFNFDFQGQNEIQIIPSTYYSSSIYIALPKNPVQYFAESIIPVSQQTQKI